MTENFACPIWGTPATDHSVGDRDGCKVNSPRAGGFYFISGSATATIRESDNSLKGRLTTWLNNQRRLGIDCPEVNTNTIKDAERSRPLHVRERADRLLRFMAGLESYPGSGFHAIGHQSSPENFFLALSWIEASSSALIPEGDREIGFFDNYLEQQGWIELIEAQTVSTHPLLGSDS